MKIGQNDVADWFLDEWCVQYNRFLHREGASAPGIPRPDLVVVKAESRVHDGTIPESAYLLIDTEKMEILEEMQDLTQVESRVHIYRMVSL